MKNCECHREKLKDKCTSFRYSDLDSLEYKLKFSISELTGKYLGQLKYGYHVDQDIKSDLEKGVIILDEIKRIKNVIKEDSLTCICVANAQLIVEKANNFYKRCNLKLSKSCRNDQYTDVSKKDQWNFSNPYCVSRQSWEELAHRVCGELGLMVEITQNTCDFLFDVSRDVISCDLLYAMSVYSAEVCKYNLTITRSKKECKLDWKMLTEKHPTCDLNYKQYAELCLGNNISYDIIAEVYNSGLTFEIENKTPYLCSPTSGDFKYAFDSFTFKTCLSSRDFTMKKLEFKLSTTELKSKYLSDYNK